MKTRFIFKGAAVFFIWSFFICSLAGCGEDSPADDQGSDAGNHQNDTGAHENDSESGDYDFDVKFVMHTSIDSFGSVYTYYSDYMLLPNGVILTGIKEPYQDVDVERYARENPKKAGTWERDGDTIMTHIDGKDSQWQSWYDGKAADDGETLNFTYRSLGAALVRGSKHLKFQSDGRYQFLDNGQEVVEAGKYRLEGYGLYLEPDQEQKKSYSFVFMPKDGKKDTKGLLIAGDNWVRVED